MKETSWRECDDLNLGITLASAFDCALDVVDVVGVVVEPEPAGNEHERRLHRYSLI